MIKNEPQDYQLARQKLEGIYRGVIEANDDTLKAGRCRIRVFGVHTATKIKTDIEGIPTDDLPWAEPVMGLLEGSVSGFGLWSVPLQGSHVMLFFENGNIMQPRYFATVPGIPSVAPDIEQGFNDPDGTYPISEILAPHKPNALNEADVHKLARDVTTSTIVESKNAARDLAISKAGGGTWDEPASGYNSVYPNNIVLATHGGLTVEMDNTPDNRRFHIYHPSNTYIEVFENGDVVIKNNNNKYEIVTNDKNIHIKSNENKTIDGNKTKKIGGNDTINIAGNKIKDVTGNDNITIKGAVTKSVTGSHTETIGGTMNITVTGNCTITAPTITATGNFISTSGTSELSKQGPQKKLMNEDLIDIFNNHTHSGVQTGTDTTGAVNSTSASLTQATANSTAS